jgi:hypothetical protein
MGWRDVQAGVASGAISYAPDEFKEGFARMGKNIVKRMNAHTDAKIQAKLDAEAEAAAERKELLKAQKAADKLDQEMKDRTRTLIKSMGHNPNDQKLFGLVYEKAKAFGEYNPLYDWYKDNIDNFKFTPTSQAQSAATQTDQALNEASGFKLSDYSDLAISESGGNPKIPSRTNEDGEVYGGKWQFGDARLKDWFASFDSTDPAMGKHLRSKYNASNLDTMPEDLQDEAATWHFKDILKYIKNEKLDEYIGKEINGITLTEKSLIAVAHLGGKGGLKKFLESGGRYDPKDELGTHLTNYAKDLAGTAPNPEGGFEGMEISGPKEFWQDPEKLASKPLGELSAMLRSNAYEEGSEAYKTIETMKDIKQAQDNEAAMKSLWGKSSRDLEQFKVIHAKELNAELIATIDEAISIAKEAEANGTQSASAKQIALDAFLERRQVSTMQPLEKEVAMGEFERLWSQSLEKTKDAKETYTKADYTADTIKYTGMLSSTVAEEVAAAEDWFAVEKPIIEKTFTQIANLDMKAKQQAFMDAGIDENFALALATGNINITNDGYGRPVIVNKLTKKPYSIGGVGSGSGETLPPEGPQQPRDLTPEEQQVIQEARQEAEEAGLIDRFENLADVEAAFGAEGFIGKLVNNVSDVFGGTLMPDSSEATSSLNALSKITKFNIISAFAGLRDSVSLKQEIETILPKAGKFWYGDAKALEDIKSLRALLGEATIQQRLNASGQGIKTSSQSEARVALHTLERLNKIYDTLIQAMEGGSIGSSDIDQDVFKTEAVSNSQTSTTTDRPPKPVSKDGLPVASSREERDALPRGWYVVEQTGEILFRK